MDADRSNATERLAWWRGLPPNERRTMQCQAGATTPLCRHPIVDITEEGIQSSDIADQPFEIPHDIPVRFFQSGQVVDVLAATYRPEKARTTSPERIP